MPSVGDFVLELQLSNVRLARQLMATIVVQEQTRHTRSRGLSCSTKRSYDWLAFGFGMTVKSAGEGTDLRNPYTMLEIVAAGTTLPVGPDRLTKDACIETISPMGPFSHLQRLIFSTTGTPYSRVHALQKEAPRVQLSKLKHHLNSTQKHASWGPASTAARIPQSSTGQKQATIRKPDRRSHRKGGHQAENDAHFSPKFQRKFSADSNSSFSSSQSDDAKGDGWSRRKACRWQAQ